MNLIISNKNLSKSAEQSNKTDHNVLDLSFVVHQHEHHRYYDFCIEVKGILKTWTVPKGPSMKPFDKRLAMMVEDNPISYKDFEGEIPNVLYDSDTVEIWDSGAYTPVDEQGNAVSEDDVENGIEMGNVNFLLDGRILKGKFALIKLHQDDDKAWLLIKQPGP